MCTQICSSQEELNAFLNDLKIKPCPFCKGFGTLNRHGVLRGYDENSQQQKSVRAHRVFCSNRNGAAGCGRTFSVCLADKVKRLSIAAPRLWSFLKLVVSGGNKTQAFQCLGGGLDRSGPYRVWRRFLQAQSIIRTALYSMCPPPDITSSEPSELTLAHLEAAFKDHPLDPVSAFQATLQLSFI